MRRLAWSRGSLLSLAVLTWMVPQIAAEEGPRWQVVYSARFGQENFVAGTMAVDVDGGVYLAGVTNKSDLPTTGDVLQPVFGGGLCGSDDFHGPGPYPCPDLFLAKLNSQGELLWVTYLGGSGSESVSSLALDAEGKVYLSGDTDSPNFPFTSRDLEPTRDILSKFLVKLDPRQQSIVYAVALPSYVAAMATDSVGAVYLTGTGDVLTPNTQPGLPRGGGTTLDIWVAKLDPQATRFEYSIILGGNGSDLAASVLVDALGQAYVCGTTNSTDFPVTAGALQTSFGGGGEFNGGDAFAFKLGSAGSALLYSTYLGGSDVEFGSSCALGVDGSLYLAGSTQGGSFPTTPDAFQRQFQGGDPVFGPTDAFVARLDPSASSLIYSTYLGGLEGDVAWTVAVDPQGNAYVGGGTQSLNFPLQLAVQSANRGPEDAFLTVLNPGGTAALFSTFFGGHESDDARRVVVSAAGELFVAGVGNAPVTPGLPHDPLAGIWAARLELSMERAPVVYLEGVVNAASLVSGVLLEAGFLAEAITPGEVITLFGQGLGPDNGVGVQLDENGRVAARTAGTEVFVNGMSAPLLYVGADQVNAIVPWGVAGSSSATIEVERNGKRSPAIEITVAEAAPGLFALDPWGMGRAAALNEDGTINSPENPAEKGSIVVLYATGAGPLDQPMEDGVVTPLTPPFGSAALPLSVWVGGAEAEILYAGPAPGLVSGVWQINVRVSLDTFSAPQVSVQLRAGEFVVYQPTYVAIR